MSSSHDVVIAGGGVSGCSTACFLAADPDFDGSILVVERDPTYENTPSARATGGIRQQFSTPENIEMGMFGAHFVKNIGEYLTVDGEVPDVGWHEGGYLLLATPEMLPAMRDNRVRQNELGANVDFLDPDALGAAFPWLNTTTLAGGFWGRSNEGWVDPYQLLQAYRRKARDNGVTFVKDEVTSLEREGARVTAAHLRDGGRVSAGAVVNSAGASGARTLAGSVGVSLPIESRKRCTFVFECREAVPIPSLVITPTGPAFRPEGRTYIGSMVPPDDWGDPECFDVELDHALFEEHLWPRMAALIPAFEAIKAVGGWSCHYDFNTLDENAIVGRQSGFENLYLAIGFSGHGLQQSPAVGRALSELIVHGEYRSLDLTRFGYERVLAGEAIVETNCY